jgi:hypothetical protein
MATESVSYFRNIYKESNPAANLARMEALARSPASTHDINFVLKGETF